jgi:hypothetical protein
MPQREGIRSFVRGHEYIVNTGVVLSSHPHTSLLDRVRLAQSVSAELSTLCGQYYVINEPVMLAAFTQDHDCCKYIKYWFIRHKQWVEITYKVRHPSLFPAEFPGILSMLEHVLRIELSDLDLHNTHNLAAAFLSIHNGFYP